jgi:hypothetical protein
MPKILDPEKQKKIKEVKEKKIKEVKEKKPKKVKPEKPTFKIEHGLFIVDFK